jgi:hypothetical protein
MGSRRRDRGARLAQRRRRVRLNADAQAAALPYAELLAAVAAD